MDIMYADEYMSFNSLVDTAASYDNQNIFMINRNGQVGVGELHSSVATKLNVKGNFVAQSQYVASTAAGNTNASDGANTWAKVCTFDPGGGQYKDANIILGVTNFNSSNPASAIISVKFRTNAHQNAYNMDVAYIAKTGGVELDEDSFKIFSDGGAGNNCVSTMELWVNKASTWSGFNFYEISMRTNYITGLTYHMNSAWQASAPTNTTQTAVTDGIELGLSTKMTDNKKLYFGGGKDLQIYHDGNHSWINDTGTGDLKIDSSRIRLYHGGNEELYTASGAIVVTGDLVVDGEGTTSSNITFNRAIDAFIKVDTMTGTDDTGKNLTLQAGRGTGTGSGGSIFFQTADVGGSSNSTANPAINKMTILGNGNVGIGVDAPGSKLEVGTTNAIVEANAATNGSGVGWFKVSDEGTSRWSMGLSKNAGLSGADFHIFEDASSNNPRFTVKDGGNVGIGNTNPGFKLDVHGTFQASGDHGGNVIIDNTGTTQTILANHSGAGTPVPWDIRESSSANSNAANYGPLHITRMNMDADGAGSNIHFRAKANDGSAQEIGGFGATIDSGLTDGADTRTGSLHFYTTDAGTNRQEKMTIKSDGKVGIGTTSPQANLHISGKTGDGVLIIEADTDNSGEDDQPYIIFEQDGGVQHSAIGSHSGGDTDNNALILSNSVSSSGIQAGMIFKTGTTAGYANAVERMRITPAGNVGIGHTTPGHKLHVASPPDDSGDYAIYAEEGNDNYIGMVNRHSGNRRTALFYRNIHADYTAQPMVEMHNDAAGDDQDVLKITQDGSGNAISATGAVAITGALTATTKSFDIEHPTKEGKRLHHGSLEGPEHAVYIRGKNNSGTIHLPDYWQGLVDEDSITVQLTAIGKPQELYVREIKNGKVRVAAKVRGNYLNYFYFIQAERKDVDKMVVEYNG